MRVKRYIEIFDVSFCLATARIWTLALHFEKVFFLAISAASLNLLVLVLPSICGRKLKEESFTYISFARGHFPALPVHLSNNDVQHAPWEAPYDRRASHYFTLYKKCNELLLLDRSDYGHVLLQVCFCFRPLLTDLDPWTDATNSQTVLCDSPVWPWDNASDSQTVL